MADPTLADRIIARLGSQPRRNAFGSVLLALALDEEDGRPLATPALDAFLEYRNEQSQQ